MGDGLGAASTEVFEGATVVETVLEEVDDLLVGDVDYGGALVEEAPHVLAKGLALFLLHHGQVCRCLNLLTSMGGTRSKVEGEDRHDLEPEGLREGTRRKIYTGSGSRSSYPTSCLG
jgi:hypothetical protein